MGVVIGGLRQRVLLTVLEGLASCASLSSLHSPRAASVMLPLDDQRRHSQLRWSNSTQDQAQDSLPRLPAAAWLPFSSSEKARWPTGGRCWGQRRHTLLAPTARRRRLDKRDGASTLGRSPRQRARIQLRGLRLNNRNTMLPPAVQGRQLVSLYDKIGPNVGPV